MAYHAPGKIDELSATALAAWNAHLSRLFASQIALARRLVEPDAKRAWMFDPIASGTDGVVEARIAWNAFPKRISDSALSPQEGWRLVDSDRNAHEEYCEWEVAKNAEGKVLRVTLTCETEDYYEFLFHNDRALLLDLYRKHVSPQVQIEHLSKIDGGYEPQNLWNFPQVGGARGLIMHMAQRNNSFAAAVNLSAVATWPRVSGEGEPIVGEQELIECASFGEKVRHSDPHIGSEINKLVRLGNEISFADPVGLYIDSVDLSDFDVPHGLAATDLIRVVRGSPRHMLRVILEAPAGAGFLLGDVRIGGERIRTGSQIAAKTNIRITGIARAAGQAASRIRCDNQAADEMLLADQVSAAALTAQTATRRLERRSILSPE